MVNPIPVPGSNLGLIRGHLRMTVSSGRAAAVAAVDFPEARVKWQAARD